MRDWWHNPTQVSPSLRLQARDAYIPANTITVWDPGARALEERWLSTPVQGSTAPDNPVFFLSEVEVVQRLGQTTDDLRSGTNRIAANGNAGNPSRYWLRSIGLWSTGVADVHNIGIWHATHANDTTTAAAFRPTIWVRR